MLQRVMISNCLTIICFKLLCYIKILTITLLSISYKIKTIFFVFSNLLLLPSILVDCWELRSNRLASVAASSLGVFLLLFFCVSIGCTACKTMPRNPTMRQELNLLTATGGRGGRKIDCGSKWCLGELNLESNDEVCTATTINAEINSSNDNTSGIMLVVIAIQVVMARMIFLTIIATSPMMIVAVMQ
jgi:hypothetical protein